MAPGSSDVTLRAGAYSSVRTYRPALNFWIISRRLKVRKSFRTAVLSNPAAFATSAGVIPGAVRGIIANSLACRVAGSGRAPTDDADGWERDSAPVAMPLRSSWAARGCGVLRIAVMSNSLAISAKVIRTPGRACRSYVRRSSSCPTSDTGNRNATCFVSSPKRRSPLVGIGASS